MRTRTRHLWQSLSTEAKLGIIVMPIVLAILGGVLIPAGTELVTPDKTAKRAGLVDIVDLERNVPLAEFVAEYATAPAESPGYVLAAATAEPAGEDATVNETGTGTEKGEDGLTKPDDAGGIDEPNDSGATDGTTGTDDPGDTTGTDDPGDASGTNDSGDTDGTDGTDETTDTEHSANTDATTDAAKAVDSCTSKHDCDGDGVPNATDACPTTPGDSSIGCVLAQIRSEPYGCTQDDMVDTLESDNDASARCEALNVVVGETTGSKPGDVVERANAIGAALHETRTRPTGGKHGRLEPVGVVVTIRYTVTGMAGEKVDSRWSLRRTKGRGLPHKWLKNRPIERFVATAETDTGLQRFWVPLPKHPRGPFVVRVMLRDEDGTSLAFDRSARIL